jgi:hypothetical protein
LYLKTRTAFQRFLMRSLFGFEKNGAEFSKFGTFEFMRIMCERACVFVDVLCLNFFFNLYLCGIIACTREMMSLRWFSAGPRSSPAIVGWHLVRAVANVANKVSLLYLARITHFDVVLFVFFVDPSRLHAAVVRGPWAASCALPEDTTISHNDRANLLRVSLADNARQHRRRAH